MPRQANDTPLTEKQKNLAESCIDYILGYSAHAMRIYPGNADKAHDAVISGFLEALRTFDAGDDVSLKPWASWVIKRRLIDQVRTYMRNRDRTCRLFDWIDFPSDEDDPACADGSEELLSCIQSDEADAVRRTVVAGEPACSVAARNGVSSRVIRRFVRDSLRLLRRPASGMVDR